jgi:hypothetical protein
MCAINYLLSIVPHAGEILLEMLAVDIYWELNTVKTPQAYMRFRARLG